MKKMRRFLFDPLSCRLEGPRIPPAHADTYEDTLSLGDPLHLGPRLIISPATGRFVSEMAGTAGLMSWVEIGDLVGNIHSGETIEPVTAKFSGWYMGLLVIGGQPVRASDALMWVSPGGGPIAVVTSTPEAGPEELLGPSVASTTAGEHPHIESVPGVEAVLLVPADPERISQFLPDPTRAPS